MCDWVAAPAGAVGVADHDFLILPHLSECWVPTGGGAEGGAPHYKYIYYKCTIIRSDYLALTGTFAIIRLMKKILLEKLIILGNARQKNANYRLIISKLNKIIPCKSLQLFNDSILGYSD